MPANGLTLRARDGLTKFDFVAATLPLANNGINTLLALVLVTGAKAYKITFTAFVRDTVTGFVVVHQARVIVQGAGAPVMVANVVEFSSSNIGANTPLWASGVGGVNAFLSAINPVAGNPVNIYVHITQEDDGP